MMPSDSALVAELKPTARSAKTNGRRMFLGHVDLRSAQARRQRDLELAFARDLGGNLSTSERLRCAQAACLTVRAELLQASVARGDEVSDEDLVRVNNALQRELAGLQSLSARRNAKPSGKAALADYLAAKASAA